MFWLMILKFNYMFVSCRITVATSHSVYQSSLHFETFHAYT